MGRTDLGVTAALQIDGRILLAGRVIDSSGNEDLGLACYLANGDPDTSFGDQGITRLPMGDASGGLVAETIVQPDGRIIVVGSALAASAAPGGVSFGFAVRRFTISGQPDGEFGNGGLVTTTFSTQDDFGRGVALQAGKIVVVGQASNKVNSNFAIARYTSAGVLDSSFGDGGKLTIEFFGLVRLRRVRCRPIRRPDRRRRQHQEREYDGAGDGQTRVGCMRTAGLPTIV